MAVRGVTREGRIQVEALTNPPMGSQGRSSDPDLIISMCKVLQAETKKSIEG